MYKEGGRGPCDRQSVTDKMCGVRRYLYRRNVKDCIYKRQRAHEVTNQKGRAVSLMEALQREHNSRRQKFEMNVTRSYSNDAMLRQISEGVRIDKVPEPSLMNSKSEWNCFRVPRTIVTQDLMK